MLLGLSGFAGVGKDTAGRSMVNWHRRAFADELKAELKDFCLKAYNLDVFTSDPEQKKFLRDLMVYHGRSMRAIDPNYWIKKVEATMKPDMNYVITDVRYANEATWIKEREGRVFLIIRPGHTAANDEEAKSIATIAQMGLFDATIDNNGSVLDLQMKFVPPGPPPVEPFVIRIGGPTGKPK